MFDIALETTTAVIARHGRRRTASLPLAYDRATQYPEAFEIDRGAAAYWIARSSRASLFQSGAVVSAAWLSSGRAPADPSFFLGIGDDTTRLCRGGDRVGETASETRPNSTNQA